MSKERFLSDVRTARTFSDTKFAQSLTWANKEILRLTAALESANQRADDLIALADESVQVIETLKASLADREGELDQALELGRVIELEKTHQDTELESLRERLRTFRKAWQDQDDTALDSAMDALFEAIPTESPDTVDGDGMHFDPDLVEKP